LIRLELDKKGLPEENLSSSTAGYLYFVRPKKKNHATYQLECTLSGEKIVLALP
jgi:hypothetical protein